MTDSSSPKKGNVFPISPITKPPTQINLTQRIGDLEEDVEATKPKEKPIVKEASPVRTTSPNKAENTQKSTDKSPRKQGEPTTSKKPDEKSPVKSLQPAQNVNQVRSAVPTHRSGDSNSPAVYNPYEEMKSGVGEEEALGKVRQENAKLRKELKSISEDLTLLVERKKMQKKVKDAPRVGDIISNATMTEKGLLSELEVAQKKLTAIQKEVAAMKEKYDAQRGYDTFQKLQDQLYETDTQIQDMVTLKKQMEKSLREKEKELDSLLHKTESKVDVTSLDENTRYYREKAREGERKKEQFEKQSQKRKEYTAKLIEEINAMKQEYKKIQEKTGYQHKEIQKPEPTKRAPVEEIKKKVPISKHIEEEIACTLDNFEKLKKEIKIIERAEDLRGKKNDRQFDDISEQLESAERNKEDMTQKMAERKKEIELLQTKLKDLSRIVRHHALAPLQKEEEQALKISQSVTSPERRLSRRNLKASDSNKAILLPKKPQPYHMLVNYAKHNFQSKGYRKDERGKPVREDEGINFNDKDVVGKQRVKIIALDIWYDDNCINGLQGVYENEQGEIIEGGAQVKNADKSKMETFETLEEDYIKEVTGFINKGETQIECLIIRTFRGETRRVGTASKDSKLFKFDINELEYPAMFYGSIREDKSGGPSRLARLGVLIATQSVEEKIAGKEKHGSGEKRHKGEKDENDHKEEEEEEHGEHGDHVDRGEEEAEDTKEIKENIEGEKSA